MSYITVVVVAREEPTNIAGVLGTPNAPPEEPTSTLDRVGGTLLSITIANDCRS